MKWYIECADCIEWMARQPDDSIDLLLTSPPYEDARTYSIAFALRSEEWVKMMFDLVAIASKKVKGPILINCEGKTEDFSYSCTPYLLMADLRRAGFNLRKPIAFHRVGIPGSGGSDYLRADWEPIVCVTRPGRLPWSDNTAMGKPPRWAPGGEMANRMTNGERVNAKKKVTRFGHATDGQVKGGHERDIVKIANPGSWVQEWYTPDEVAAKIKEASDAMHCIVGGGVMGSDLAHKNEAPFPERLAEFCIRSFCPEDGVVCDPFSGSGTVAAVAIKFGRRFKGCDIRPCQVELTTRRIKDEAEGLFT
jgi:site-specific DNA-methyltransferase (adenine-specific)